MSAAAKVAAAGIDPMRFLESKDQVEILIISALTEKFYKHQDEIDKNRATQIANAIARSQGAK